MKPENIFIHGYEQFKSHDSHNGKPSHTIALTLLMIEGGDLTKMF